MNRLRTFFRRTRKEGNALLFSLLIMGAALTASMGMATIVTGEISNVSLIPPSERAYYKAESFVEQGLWQKKQDPKFQASDKEDLLEDFPSFLCTGNCFLTTPRTQSGSLIRYESSTSFPEEKLVLPHDKVVQLDIDTSDVTAATGRFDLGSIEDEDGLEGVEVTVIAYPKEAPFTDTSDSFGVPTGTPVFVEKRLFRSGDGQLYIDLGPPNTNKLGEPFLPLNDSIYRLRLKALGADTTVEPTATEGLSTRLDLLLPDFRVQSVAEDGRARRGIEVLVPATEQIASIFDFVIFSDLTLSKTDAKQERIKSLKVTVYEDTNRNCTADPGDPGLGTIPVSVGSAYSQSTDAEGVARFAEVLPGNYNVSIPANPGPGMTVCNPRVKPIGFANDSTTEVKELSFLVQPPQRVPVYRFYNPVRFDHYYTTNPCPHGSASTGCSGDGYIPGRAYFGGGGWNYEFIAGFAYNVQVAGTEPVYQAWHNGNRDSDHFYTMSKSEWDYWTAPGRFYSDGPEDGPGDLWVARRGIAWYMRPLGGGCTGGTVPFHRRFYIDGSGARNHLYSQNQSEASPWAYEGITGCIWTTRN